MLVLVRVSPTSLQHKAALNSTEYDALTLSMSPICVA